MRCLSCVPFAGVAALSLLSQPAVAAEPAPPAAAEPASSGLAAAATPDVAAILGRDTLDLTDLLRIADAMSPALAAADHGARAAEGRVSQAGAFANPTLELEAEGVPADDARLADGDRTIGLSWPVEFFGRRGRVAAARGDARAERHESAAERRAVQRAILETACEVIRLRDAVAASGTARTNAARLDDIARTRADVRAEPKTHAHAARIERASIDAEHARLAAEERTALLRLEAMLGCEGLRAKQLVTGDIFGMEQARGALGDDLDSNPRLLAARARLDAARGASSAAGRSWIPEPELRVAWGVDAAEEEFLEAGAAIPLPLFDRGRGEAAGARADARRREEELRATTAALRAEVDGAVGRWAAADESLRRYRDDVAPMARESFELALEGYEAGRLPFLDLLDALRTLADAARTELELRGEHDAAAAALWELAPSTSEGVAR